ncbi:hypothetical protein [Acetivibrio ethanolgignens]|uniref:ATPase n=1 Tax=Acetivibrio ethanolgignens TaxID=290052 RepID=A0A0V8QGE9_9FIRM|nr:hypothetical protein [Acetivibrio ethanolgignens]KSV59532.1 ATPase [Acetivibrio ethanolgignens]
MGTSRIEQSIEDIYEFIEGCRPQPLSSNKVIVPKDELYDLLDELRLRTPDEIKRYRKVLQNREAIMADAEERAANIIEETKKRSEALVNESEIMQQAFEQANQVVTQATEEARRILEEANAEADQIRMGALSYTNDLLSNAEQALSTAYEGAMNHYQGLTQMLKDSLTVVQNNRAELGMDPAAGAVQDSDGIQLGDGEEDAFNMEEFNFDADTFLEDID